MLLLPVPESLKKSKQRQKCLSVSNSDEDILKKTITLKNEQFWKNTNIQLNHRHQSKVLQISSSWYKPSQPSETRKVLRPPPPKQALLQHQIHILHISAWHSRECLMLRAHTLNYLWSWSAQKHWLALWEREYFQECNDVFYSPA